VISGGRGAYVWGADGNSFIDYRLAFGPIILGHADPLVNRRVHQAIDDGTLFAHTRVLEVELAEKIVRMCPGVDLVRFANSGTEATMHALRIARGGATEYFGVKGDLITHAKSLANVYPLAAIGAAESLEVLHPATADVLRRGPHCEAPRAKATAARTRSPHVRAATGCYLLHPPPAAAALGGRADHLSRRSQ
jgi:glutamate-1-semialdehyde aminotransferase